MTGSDQADTSVTGPDRGFVSGTVAGELQAAEKPADFQEAVGELEDAHARALSLLAQMTQDEKIALVTGQAGVEFLPNLPPPPAESRGGDGYAPGVARLGIPDLQIVGSGLGVNDWFYARKDSQATAMPASPALAATFDVDLASAWGAVLGREARTQGFNVLLGGSMNLSRDPRGGRAFEYLGEDPVLAGRMAARMTMGTQGEGVVATVKHYAVNDIENGRFGIDVRIDERAMREAELLAFEIAVIEGRPGSVMSSYNKVNGLYASQSPYLLTEVLKGEWGFEGWVMSDWGAVHGTASYANAGLDQEFFDGAHFGPRLAAAVKTGQVPQSRLDDMVTRILATMIRMGALDPREAPETDSDAGSAVAQEVAERGAVLLTNDGILPLEPAALRTVAVIGFSADIGVITGGGSSQVIPWGGGALPLPPKRPRPRETWGANVWVPDPPLEALRRRLPNAEVRWDPGFEPVAAAAAATGADVAIVFAGRYREEGFDLPDLSLGDGQEDVIAAVAAANPRTVVVLEIGGAHALPWHAEVSAILAAWYPGQRGGEAIARLLLGEVAPSGRLPLTFPRSEADLPRPVLPGPPLGRAAAALEMLDPVPSEVRYDEGALVGYKWYDDRGIEPLFPFGHGLTYTSFSYADVEADLGEVPTVSLTLTNDGDRAGVEIAQVYVTLPEGEGPPLRLAGWARAALAPGETARVTATLEPRALANWNVPRKSWVVPEGSFAVHVGASSRDLRLHCRVGVPVAREL